MGPIRKMFVFLVVLLVVIALLPYVLPWDLMFTDELQKALSAKLKRPVDISHLSFEYTPYPTFTIEHLQLGPAAKDGQIDRVEVQPDLLTLFSPLKRVHRCVLSDAVFTAAFIRELPDLLKSDASDRGYRLKLITVHKGALIAGNKKSYAPIEAELMLNPDQTFAQVKLSNTQHSLEATVTPSGEHYHVDIIGRDWQTPTSKPAQIDDIAIEALTNGQSLQIQSIRGTAFGGHFSGSGSLDWADGWQFAGDFDLDGLDGDVFTTLFSPKTNISGRINGKVQLVGHSAQAESLGDEPTVSAQITSTDGELRGFDFVQPLHRNAVSNDGVTGGSTKYDQLTGNLKIEGKHIAVSDAHLTSGSLVVLVNFGANNGKLSGSARAQLGKGVGFASESMRIGGTFDEPELFSQGHSSDGASSVVQITTNHF